MSDGDLKVIADSAHGYVGADLAGVVSKGMDRMLLCLCLTVDWRLGLFCLSDLLRIALI